MSNKRIALLSSGGDAPGMNAAIRSIVLAAHANGIDVFGFHHGYNGLIENECRILTDEDVHGIIHQGGTILKSARCKAMLSVTGLQQAALTLIKNKIDGLIVIGGDGSFSGLIALEQHWDGQLIGLPGTIDNDLDGTDYTIGFSTAINTAINSIDKIRDTADAFDRFFVVELMGRHSGHIAFSAGIACGAEQILSFENFPFKEEQAALREIKYKRLAESIKKAAANRHQSYLIVMAENLIEGGAPELVNILKTKYDIDGAACVLGHIQRGGNPDAKDRLLATKLGIESVNAFIEGKTNIMIGEQNNEPAGVVLSYAVNQTKRVSGTMLKAQEDVLAITSPAQI
jgi:6-phosphofructokinase 1